MCNNCKAKLGGGMREIVFIGVVENPERFEVLYTCEGNESNSSDGDKS